MPLESSIVPTRDGLFELSLHGRLHRPHWVVQLLAALSQLRISIRSGRAAQDHAGEWTSKFLLDFSHSTADPQKLDYAAFAEQTAAVDRNLTPQVTRFELTRRADQFLQLKVEAPEQLGFLATLLSRVSIFALFPLALEMDASSGHIRDSIVLRGIGDRGPSETAFQTLDRMLRSFVVPT
jgi:hypothetical protein